MRILLTNDDGIEALGLKALVDALCVEHEIWVVAPEMEKSGSSHSITLRDSIRVRPAGERKFSCRGTPADCIMISLLGHVPKGIELVISGINHGPNLGTDILYSGTASAASQGVLMGVPSVALSINAYAPPFDFRYATAFTANNIALFRELADGEHYLNINFPNGKPAVARPSITFPSRRIYRDELSTYRADNGSIFCFFGGQLPDSRREEGTDEEALSLGRISISPISVHPANCGPIEGRYRSVEFA